MRGETGGLELSARFSRAFLVFMVLLVGFVSVFRGGTAARVLFLCGGRLRLVSLELVASLDVPG